MINWMNETFVVYASDSKKKKKIQINLLGVWQVFINDKLEVETNMIHQAISSYNKE